MNICLCRGTAGRGLPLDQFVALAADAGFPGADVDLAYGADHGAAALRDLYAKHNLSFGGWGPPHDFRGDPAKAADGLKRLDTFAAIAKELGIDSCATYIMPSADKPFGENWHFHVQNLKPIAQRLAAHGLRFGLEFVAPHHLRRQGKHEFIFTPGLMLELAAEVGPNVGLLIDCFHLHCAGEPMSRIAQIPVEKIVLCHLNDAPKIPVHEVEDFKRTLPGEGAIDVRGFLQALEKINYTGPVSLEVFSEELKSMPPAEAAKRAWKATAPFAS